LTFIQAILIVALIIGGLNAFGELGYFVLHNDKLYIPDGKRARTSIFRGAILCAHFALSWLISSALSWLLIIEMLLPNRILDAIERGIASLMKCNKGAKK
jgi:hypothetical protein